MSAATPLVVPQVNVNDDTVLFLKWVAGSGASVAAGELVCEVETTKAAAEVTAPAAGFLEHAAQPGDRVAVGATIGAIGESREAAQALLRAAPSHPAGSGDGLQATPKARALAAQHGISLEAVRARGVRGTIKESDVRALMAGGASGPADTLSKYLVSEGAVSASDGAVAASLRRSTSQLILTSVDMDCRLAAANARLQSALAAGRMISVLHVVIDAAARALPKFPRLMSVVSGDTRYRYKAVDVAFVVRANDGRLFTPVVRGADRLPLDRIASTAQALALQVMRGAGKAEQLEGACFTISQVPIPGTARVVALPNLGQSAVLGVSAERSRVALVNGVATAEPFVTLTLNYDHALCDGVYAASFLAAIVADLEATTSTKQS
jgi:pyruvate dehydrogenase E2 component (dihydrolipoamide acetyltransferase)